jgi:hypothetical protein
MTASNAPMPHQARIPGFVDFAAGSVTRMPHRRRRPGSVDVRGGSHGSSELIRRSCGSETNVPARIGVPERTGGKPFSFLVGFLSVMTRPETGALWQVPARRLQYGGSGR